MCVQHMYDDARAFLEKTQRLNCLFALNRGGIPLQFGDQWCWLLVMGAVPRGSTISVDRYQAVWLKL